LSQMNPVHTLVFYFFRIHYRLFSIVRLHFPSVLFPLSFPTKMLFTYPVRATCLVDHIALECKWWSSLSSFLEPVLTSHLFGPRILLSTLSLLAMAALLVSFSVW
jgi:hypothetical protein